MLPFLQKNKQGMQSGLIVKTRTPDEQPDQDDPQAAIKACSRALIEAVHAKDEAGVSEALSDAFEILESQEHDENSDESPSPHSYDAQDEE